MNLLIHRALTGFAAGVMVAASVWSLLVPAMEQAEDMGQGAVSGFFAGCAAAVKNGRNPSIGQRASGRGYYRIQIRGDKAEPYDPFQDEGIFV